MYYTCARNAGKKRHSFFPRDIASSQRFWCMSYSYTKYAHTHTLTHMNIYMYTCIYTCAMRDRASSQRFWCVREFINMLYVRTSPSIPACVCVHVCVCVCMCVCVCVRVY